MQQKPGPIPKRSDQTIRRNKPDIELAKISAIGSVPIPDLNLVDPHPLVSDIYESLKESAQNKYYEPSDWQYARLTMHLLDDMLKQHRLSAVMLASVNQMLTSLLMTEGDRRRVRMEIERNPGDGGKVLQVADLFRQRLGQG